MAQRASGFECKEHDGYQTLPRWPIDVLIPHLGHIDGRVWECACGEGKMAASLAAHHLPVFATDITQGIDFLKETPRNDIGAIVTNPPYNLSVKFIEHALYLMERMESCSVVAMLLKIDYDSAKSRRHLFANCPYFTRKIVFTSRIVWFEPATASPSENHAFYLWRKDNKNSPTIAYGP